MKIDIKKLRELAGKATPGNYAPGDFDGIASAEDCVFHAALSPEVVIALLDVVALLKSLPLGCLQTGSLDRRCPHEIDAPMCGNCAIYFALTPFSEE